MRIIHWHMNFNTGNRAAKNKKNKLSFHFIHVFAIITQRIDDEMNDRARDRDRKSEKNEPTKPFCRLAFFEALNHDEVYIFSRFSYIFSLWREEEYFVRSPLTFWFRSRCDRRFSKMNGIFAIATMSWLMSVCLLQSNCTWNKSCCVGGIVSFVGATALRSVSWIRALWFRHLRHIFSIFSFANFRCAWLLLSLCSWSTHRYTHFMSPKSMVTVEIVDMLSSVELTDGMTATNTYKRHKR